MNEPLPQWMTVAAKRIVNEYDEWQREAAEKAPLDPEEAKRLMLDSVMHALWTCRRKAGEA